MKMKSILFALALSGMSVFGQGLVTFQNSTFFTPIKIELDGEQPGVEVLIPGGGDFSFYFIYGLSAENLNHTSLTYLSGDPGRITTDGTQDIVLNVAGGQAVFFQMFSYLTSAGSYANAVSQGAPVYQSGIISLTPSISPTPGNLMFGTTVGSTFQGFTFSPVPEPSTVALGILGAGAILLFRRGNNISPSADDVAEP